MTTANPEQARRPAPAGPTGRPRRSGVPLAGTPRCRDALDRPLTSYYLLLGASALLLTIGLIMVLSASSVYSFEHNDGDSYAVVKRQLMWVAIGAARAPGSRAGCRSAGSAGWPGPATSSRWCCCCSPRSSASRVNGNTELAGARPDR